MRGSRVLPQGKNRLLPKVREEEQATEGGRSSGACTLKEVRCNLSLLVSTSRKLLHNCRTGTRQSFTYITKGPGNLRGTKTIKRSDYSSLTICGGTLSACGTTLFVCRPIQKDFCELRRYHTRPLRLNWGSENVHFGKTYFRDQNINARIFMFFCFMFCVFH